jgi:hypothetical protein
MNPNTVSQPVIDAAEVQKLIAMRETQKALKSRLELMDQAVKESEAVIIAAVDAGAAIEGLGVDLRIEEVSRRYPAWKEHFISRMGKAVADEVLEHTAPVTYRRVVIK